MKKVLFLLVLIAATKTGLAQKLSFIALSGYGSKESFYYTTSDNVSIVLSKDGNITEYGTEYPKEFYGYYPGRLQKYMGRIDYYGPTDNEAFRGKVKYIGLTLITYYGSYDDEALKGKVKSIGNVQFDYYASFEDASYKGNIKNVGGTIFTWCSSFDDKLIKGRLKTIGNTRFDWYTSFDDKAIAGKIKSIDVYPFAYYTSFEDNYHQKGFLKSGFQTKYINGINYYVRN